MRQSSRIYKNFTRSSVKEPHLQERKLTPQQMLSLRYQCALENKDFETAKALKALLDGHQEQSVVSDARQQAEALFKK
jgi:hypothetical protein